MEYLDILTPVGRLVGGSPFVGRDTDSEGRPLVIKSGANTGQPRKDYYVAVAVPKSDASFKTLILDKLIQKARQGFPHLTFTEVPGGLPTCNNPEFAFKITDGDSAVPNSKGIAPNTREGYAGHWVMHFSGGRAPKVYTAGGEAIIVNADECKRGYYVRVSGSVCGNSSTSQPGVYLNHDMVERVAFGEEIISGPDAAAVFGSAPAVAPAGAMATPPAGAPIATSTAVTPAHDFVNGPGAPAQAGPPPAQAGPGAPAQAGPPPAVERFTNAQGWTGTRDQYRANGWADAQIDALPRA